MIEVERGELVRAGDVLIVDSRSGRARRPLPHDRGRKFIVPASGRVEGGYLSWVAGDDVIDLTDGDPERAERPTKRELPDTAELELLRAARLDRVTAAGSVVELAMKQLASKGWVTRVHRVENRSLWRLAGEGFSFGLTTPLTAQELAIRVAQEALFSGVSEQRAMIWAATALTALEAPIRSEDGRSLAAGAVLDAQQRLADLVSK